MSSLAGPPAPRHRPRAVTVGLALFAVGLVFLLITVLPFFFGDHNRPLWLNLACLLAPLGFIIAITSVVRSGRAQQRAALAEVTRPDPDGA
ncbi:MAG TPA: hypothetical protein VHO01_03395 [Jatrophihabitans sp.]|nr:hypothetical protein [Jatrophihabitans sp.]